ncbi:voltage-dependent T-type calcium channel subunit alpha-1G [Eurytemora carolleeae]|uniref:voltage-dependent T-type calcium channel subunit alpha-1G n=1 Tax=Eurytemora carolleeae TaxID=1294199 RepID=UPI000C76F8CD|nr:voltage-dependent T-type calcium channel subunit alpha-1G [Eurytemora carolleeae]|eukprot:XP_023326004.1 voltage-dependent T-type calcium channel subunit alpha-1G-like [Eurytemora affinis]
MDCEMTSLLQNVGDEEKENDGQANKIKYKVEDSYPSLPNLRLSPQFSPKKIAENLKRSLIGKTSGQVEYSGLPGSIEPEDFKLQPQQNQTKQDLLNPRCLENFELKGPCPSPCISTRSEQFTSVKPSRVNQVLRSHSLKDSNLNLGNPPAHMNKFTKGCLKNTNYKPLELSPMNLNFRRKSAVEPGEATRSVSNLMKNEVNEDSQFYMYSNIDERVSRYDIKSGGSSNTKPSFHLSPNISNNKRVLTPTYPWDWDTESESELAELKDVEERINQLISPENYTNNAEEMMSGPGVRRCTLVDGVEVDGVLPQFSETSFKYITLENPIRKICIKILLNPWFERLTMTVILFNCITLGMYEPCPPLDPDTGQPECGRNCKLLKICDDVIYAYFSVEMMIKMIALGVFGRGCYLSETWNKLDCFIVTSGMIESALEYCLDVEKLNLSAIRTVRVLRPLRAINRIPSMRILVMLLLDTLPMLGNVLLLCFFVFFIFGIVGVQLWAGLLRQRCYIDDHFQAKLLHKQYYKEIPHLHFQVEEMDLLPDYICAVPNSYGMHKCSQLPPFKMNGEECTEGATALKYNKSACVNWNQYFTKCTTGPSNPFHGAISFDNIGLAWVAIFLVISLEGWTDVMYFVQDAHSFWNWIYFVMLIVIGSFFMINLCLVVIATQFSETKRRETAKMKAERAKFTSSSTLSSFTNSETTNLYREIIRLIYHLLRRAYNRAHRLYRAVRARRLAYKERKLLAQQADNQGKTYNVMKNVSTHSMINANDGELDLRLELEDIGIYAARGLESPPVNYAEKTTQTDLFQPLANDNGRESILSPNGTSPCNHPTLSCQELLEMSTPITGSTAVQLVFDKKNLKYCSTFNLAEVMNSEDQSVIYNLGSQLDLITPTQKKPMFRCLAGVKNGICGFVNSVSSCLNRLVDHNIFQQGILLCIFINTFSMGIEYHDQPVTLTKVVEISNLAFSIIFSVEMLLKISAYGIPKYLSDGFNVFDGFIVILSGFEIYNGVVNGISSEGSGLSVLRTFRLLRILKLVRFLPNLRRQLIVMLRTMDNVAVFFGLLMLFIFIFSILGMNLFGCKFQDEFGTPDRKNFDSLLWATVTVFQVLTQEDWNIVLFAGMERTSHWAALYFVALMTFGNYVLFNLLVAILVEGFSNQDDKKSSIGNSESKDEGRMDSFESAAEPVPVQGQQTHYAKSNLVKEQILRKGSRILPPGTRLCKQCSTSLQSLFKEGGRPGIPRRSPKMSKSMRENLMNSVLEIGMETTIVVPCTYCGDKKDLMAARVVQKEEVETNPAFAEFRAHSRIDSETTGPYRRISRGSGRKSSNCLSSSSQDSLRNNSSVNKKKSKKGFVKDFTNNNLAGTPPTPPPGFQDSTILARIQKVLKDREAYSLYIFKPEDKIRTFCQDLTSKGWFDFVILVFISANCITLAMERPNIPPWSLERSILDLLNNIFTVVFAIEMGLKAVAAGLVYGEESYFSSGWNRMDGTLVLISLIDAAITVIAGKTSKIFGMLRVFRLVRALRPLRVINRAPGLKLVVQTLLSSLKPIGNIVLICCTFFIIFGILGVQLFKVLRLKWNRWLNQKYNFDNLGHALMSLFVLSSKDGWVDIMYHGLDATGVDMQPKRNYNEWRLVYFISFLLLVGFFVLNMFVGVVVENFHRCRAEQEKEERARRAAKRAKKIEERRRKMLERPYYMDYSRPRLVVHQIVTSKYFDLAISAVIGLNVITMAMEFYMMPLELEYALKVFNYFFTAIFILEAAMKVSALGVQRYLSDRWNQLDVGIVFLSVVGIVLEEMKGQVFPVNPTIIRVMRVLRIARVLKLLKMAKGIRALLDTVMQALPQLTSSCQLPLCREDATSPPLTPLYRGPYLVIEPGDKFFKLQIGTKIDTVSIDRLKPLFYTDPVSVAQPPPRGRPRLQECDENYPCQGLGEHAHFRSFGMAFLTLFRIATGDNWNGIMKDTLREECDPSEECLRNCCVSGYFAPLFFVVFVLMAQFVLVNVVVAVLMKHLEESHKQMEDDVEVELELEKQLALAHELFPAT